MIRFNVPAVTGYEEQYMREAINNGKISGDGSFTLRCSKWMKEKTHSEKVLLTTSGTHALEMAAILCEIKDGDEVIMPSYTFSSTANAFVLRGAKIVFVDIRPDTMNIDENLIENAVTTRTKAIIPMHYAGVSCEMDKIIAIAQKYKVFIIEDAAQGMMSTYRGNDLGSMGDYGCYSFHETKNFTMGEGGALLIKDKNHIESAEIIREKGTNRSKYFRGEIDKYSWVDCGSSYLPSDMNCAFLWAQLEHADDICQDRMTSWMTYMELLTELKLNNRIDLPIIPKECSHNAHMFYIKLRDIEDRSRFISYMRENDVSTAYHYVPLHSAKAGLEFGQFCGEDKYTTGESERLVRLPMYYGLREDDIKEVARLIHKYCSKYK